MRKAWCVMVATEDYLPGAKIVFETLKATNTQYPFILLLEEKIPQIAIQECGLSNIPVFYFRSLKGSNERRELYTVNKIWAYKIPSNQYQKIGLLDADLRIIKNIDHYLDFETGSAFPSTDYSYGEYQDDFVDIGNQGGLNGSVLIIEPNYSKFNDLLDIHTECINDEQIWDKMYPLFMKQYWKHLPVGDWRGSSEQLRIIHDDGFPKPWMVQ